MVTPMVGSLKRIWGTSSSDVYAIGTDHTILRYNGNAWSVISYQTGYGPYYGIWGSSPSNIYVVGSGRT